MLTTAGCDLFNIGGGLSDLKLGHTNAKLL